MRFVRCVWGILLVAAILSVAIAQEDNAPTASAGQAELFKKFEKTLSKVALVGHFTVLGKDNQPLREERYEIESVKKIGSGDLWLFQARIKYGEKTDVKLPLPLQVKWAGTTPVITLDNVTIPGLGTFNSRVIIDGDVYAGTWGHDDVKGHLFGRIESLEKSADTD